MVSSLPGARGGASTSWIAAHPSAGTPPLRNDAFFKGKLDRFIDSTGRRYTLTELATREGSLLGPS